MTRETRCVKCHLDHFFPQ
uniref:Uncharacterized protein n=1 Tax=Arundo donax TaxID=35708 RepID=A0A0A9BKV4_ARUDO